ncbi:MAG: histidine phosphatase family protein [bacterium]|nr:histidine phosphatase family protein [bacterium]
MKVIIVRHGQTDDNAKTIVSGGGSDSALSAEGVNQAKKLGHWLKNEKIDVVYVSDQRRAIHTAEHILEHHPLLKIVKHKSLRERHYGEFEGKPDAIRDAAYEKSGLPFELFKPKGGESCVEVYGRVEKFFSKLSKKHKDDTVLIVGHGRTIGLLLLKIFDKPIHEENQSAHKPANTGVAILEILEGKPVKIHKLNSLEHLN